MKQKQEFSAGGVVYKQIKTQNLKVKTVFLLGKHSGYHKWVLPKGLIEAREKPEETAVRETEEEMGVVARIIMPEPIHIVKYSYQAEYKIQDQQNDKLQMTNIPSSHFTNAHASKGQGKSISKFQIQNDFPTTNYLPDRQASQLPTTNTNENTRRVQTYQESGGTGVLVHKTVTFYLMEWVCGDPVTDHGWEMEEAGWFEYIQCIEMMGFVEEKEAVKIASNLLAPRRQW